MTRLHDATPDNPFIIAEVGSNWTVLNHCKDSIAAAKACGADAVKFQAFDDLSLYGRMTIYDNPYKLPLHWIPELKEKANACGIELMVTAFSPELVNAVDPFVEVHKIASSDLTCPHMLKAVKAKGKPILLSCGGSNQMDIAMALAILDGADVTLMYCNSAYPSQEHNLFQIESMQRKFLNKVGFSDHSLDVIYAPLSACKHFNVSVIEKHVTFFEITGPDGGHSLDATQFKRMCDYLRGKNDPYIVGPSAEEHSMFLRHNRRLLAISDIAPGEVFRFGKNYGSFRSLENDTRGVIPFAWNYDPALAKFGFKEDMGFEGRQAKHAIKMGIGICRDDIEGT